MSFDPTAYPTLEYRTLGFQRERYRAISAVSEYVMRNGEWDHARDDMRKQMIHRLTVDVLARKTEATISMTWWVPNSWWDAFKIRYLPKRKVRMVPRTKTRRIDFKALWPEASIRFPDNLGPVQLHTFEGPTMERFN